MSLPLAGIEAILSSDDLQIASEDVVYDFILKWARTYYPLLEDRREILGSRLANFIRFPLMTFQKLGTILICSDFEPQIATKLTLEAHLFKTESPHRQRSLATEQHSYIERAYKYRPIKVVEIELPRPQCIVYLNLKREECAGLFPSGNVYSRPFSQTDNVFNLYACCNMDNQNSFNCFRLFIGLMEKGSVSVGVNFKFSAWSKPLEKFKRKFKCLGYQTLTGGRSVGFTNLFQIPWMSFIGDNSDYFINGILHLRADLRLN